MGGFFFKRYTWEVFKCSPLDDEAVFDLVFRVDPSAILPVADGGTVLHNLVFNTVSSHQMNWNSRH